MDSNTHSTPIPGDPGSDDDNLAGLGGLAVVIDNLATQDLHKLSATAKAERLLAWRQLLDRQEGLWLQELAALDACGAAGADQGEPASSTAGWLRRRLRMSAGVALGQVRAARALFRGPGPLTQTAQALVAGVISPAHAKVIVDGTSDLPDHVKLDADPILAELAGRVDPPRLRQAAAHLGQVADPEGADRQAARRHQRRGLWLAPTIDDMVAVGGLLEPEAGSTLLAALEPLARPADAHDTRSGSQRRADALWELARRSVEGGWLPKAGGVRPQLLVTVDLETLLGRPGAVGGEVGRAGPLEPEACRRLACDGTVTRVVVTRQPGPQPGPDPRRGHGAVRHPGVDLDPRVVDDSGVAAPATRSPSDPEPQRPGQPPPAAVGGHDLVAPDPGRCPPAAVGGGPGDPSRRPGPAGRPGRAGRGLCVPGV